MEKGSSVSENCSRCRFDGDDSGDTRGKCNSGRRLGLEESKWEVLIRIGILYEMEVMTLFQVRGPKVFR